MPGTAAVSSQLRCRHAAITVALFGFPPFSRLPAYSKEPILVVPVCRSLRRASVLSRDFLVEFIGGCLVEMLRGEDRRALMPPFL